MTPLTLPEAAEILGVLPKKVQQLTASGALPFMSLPIPGQTRPRRYVNPDQLLEWAKKHNFPKTVQSKIEALIREDSHAGIIP
jgi:Helix-turn-helix domain